MHPNDQSNDMVGASSRAVRHQWHGHPYMRWQVESQSHRATASVLWNEYLLAVAQMEPHTSSMPILGRLVQQCIDLGNYEAALTLANQILQMDPTDPQGYLHLASIHAHLGSHEQLFNTFSSAVVSVRPDHRLYPVMVQQRNFMHSELYRPRDFSLLFPYEVLCLIFKQLDFRDQVNCFGVCRSWRRFLLSQFPYMCHHVDFFSRASVKVPTFYVWMGRINTNEISSLRLKGNATFASRALTYLKRHPTPALKSLELCDFDTEPDILTLSLNSFASQLTHLNINGTDMFLDLLMLGIASDCPNLTHLKYSSTASRTFYTVGFPFALPETPLGLLSLEISSPERELPIDSVLRCCPNLRHLFLDLYDFLEDEAILAAVEDHCHVLNYLSVRHNKLEKTLPDSEEITLGLREIRFYSDTGLTDDSVVPTLQKNFGTLEILHLCGNMAVGPGTWQTMGVLQLPVLRELHFHQQNDQVVELYGPADLCLAMRSMRSLEVASFHGVTSFTDQVLYELCKNTPRLTVLDVSNCQQVTGHAIRYAVRQKKDTLKRLVINNCDSIGIGAIAYAEDILGADAVEAGYDEIMEDP